MKQVMGILLAAGASQRFGADKLRQPLQGGEWVGERACRNLLAVTGHVLAVVRPEAGPLAERLRKAGAETIVCQEAWRGMGASLACGIRASLPQTQGWLVALADMPWIKTETIQAVAQAILQGEELAAPCHLGQRGHPVGFSAHHRVALSALDGDEGAKSVIQSHAVRLRLITVDDPGVLRDIDLPTDLPPLPFA